MKRAGHLEEYPLIDRLGGEKKKASSFFFLLASRFIIWFYGSSFLCETVNKVVFIRQPTFVFFAL